MIRAFSFNYFKTLGTLSLTIIKGFLINFKHVLIHIILLYITALNNKIEKEYNSIDMNLMTKNIEKIYYF